jgi:hypothetical protein
MCTSDEVCVQALNRNIYEIGYTRTTGAVVAGVGASDRIARKADEGRRPEAIQEIPVPSSTVYPVKERKETTS